MTKTDFSLVYFLPTLEDLNNQLNYFWSNDVLRTHFTFLIERTSEHHCIYKFSVIPNTNYYETLIRKIENGSL